MFTRDIENIENRLYNELGRRKKIIEFENVKTNQVISHNEELKQIREKIEAAQIRKQHEDQIFQHQQKQSLLKV